MPEGRRNWIGNKKITLRRASCCKGTGPPREELDEVNLLLISMGNVCHQKEFRECLPYMMFHFCFGTVQICATGVVPIWKLNRWAMLNSKIKRFNFGQSFLILAYRPGLILAFNFPCVLFDFRIFAPPWVDFRLIFVPPWVDFRFQLSRAKLVY